MRRKRTALAHKKSQLVAGFAVICERACSLPLFLNLGMLRNVGDIFPTAVTGGRCKKPHLRVEVGDECRDVWHWSRLFRKAINWIVCPPIGKTLDHMLEICTYATL